MKNIKIDISKADLKLTQIEFDAMVNNRNTINLSKRMTTKEIKRNRNTRIQFNTAKHILK